MPAINGPKEVFLKMLGLVLAAWGVLAINYNIYTGHFWWAFCFCYLALILAGLGLVTKKEALVFSQFNIVFLPLLIWLFDFLSGAVTGKSFWGVSNYFSALPLLAKLISIGHLALFIALLLALFLLRVKNFGFWKWSVLEVILVFLGLKFFSPAAENVNCVFSSCFPALGGLPFYPVYWFLLMFIFLAFTQLFLVIFFSGKKAVLTP